MKKAEERNPELNKDQKKEQAEQKWQKRGTLN